MVARTGSRTVLVARAEGARVQAHLLSQSAFSIGFC